MSEQDRSRLYEWWCEHADESLAEYAMSCLSPVPLPDLATKEDFARLDAKVDTKVDLLASQHRSDRDDDRRVSRVRHYWLVGIWVSAVVSVWLDASGVIG